MEKRELIKLLVVALVFFVLGAALGILYQSSKSGSAFSFGKTAETIKILASKAVVSTVLYGQVQKIDGKNLTLGFNGDSATVKIKDDATVYALNQSGTGSAQQAAKFEDIKEGYNLSINLKVLADGQLEGQTVFILPAPTAVK